MENLKMQKPAGIQQAVILIWISIAISAVSSSINKWIGAIDEGEFAYGSKRTGKSPG
jgi:hypothetical protein